ncbi:MAG: cysteine desulfurase, partial [Hyphomicrobiales bacterium]
VAPDSLPSEMMWHKWESYATWLSGFALLMWVYYLGADLYLIDPAIRALPTWAAIAIGIGGLALGWIIYDALCRSPLKDNAVALGVVGFTFVIAAAWAFQQVFSGRGAMLHTGALMATIMSGNVFFVIIPNQHKIIADLTAGKAADPALGKAGKTRSTHNNYLTLPVLFLMLSTHYPMVYMSPFAYVIVGLVLVAGALIRHFYNERHAGRGNHWWTWGVAAVALIVAAYISATTSPAAREQLGFKKLPREKALAAAPKLPDEVDAIVTSRCSMCHAREPSWDGIVVPPKGVRLDAPDHIYRNRDGIRMFSVMTHAMPPNNITQMTDAERRTLAQWLRKL